MSGERAGVRGIFKGNLYCSSQKFQRLLIRADVQRGSRIGLKKKLLMESYTALSNAPNVGAKTTNAIQVTHLSDTMYARIAANSCNNWLDAVILQYIRQYRELS